MLLRGGVGDLCQPCEPTSKELFSNVFKFGLVQDSLQLRTSSNRGQVWCSRCLWNSREKDTQVILEKRICCSIVASCDVASLVLKIESMLL